MLKVPDKEVSQSIQRNKEDKILNNNLKVTRSTPTRFTNELDGDIVLQQVRLHSRSGSTTMNGSRIKVGIIGDLRPGQNSKNFKVEISTGKPVTSQQEVIPTKSFSFLQVVVFRLPATFSSQAIDVGVNRTPPTLHVQTQTLCLHVTHDVTCSRVARDV